MEKIIPTNRPAEAGSARRQWNIAFGLAVFTIVFNIAEGLVSIFFGLKDEALTLFGFGLDSFVETISASGVAMMILRIRRNAGEEKSRFERLALQITGWCFYGLSIILAAGAVVNIVEGNTPSSTLAGIIISTVSIIFMAGLIYAKKSLGRKLDSPPIIADANCNLVCVYMSIVLLIASGTYAIFQLGFIDAIGTAGIIYFSIREGRESFKKAKGLDTCSCHAVNCSD